MGVKVFKPPARDITISNSLIQRNQEALKVGKRRCLFRSLLQFDISTLPFPLTILHAELHLYIFENLYPNVMKKLNIYQILANWDERTADFHNPIYALTPVASTSFTNANHTFLCFDVTSLLINWYTGRDVNLGVLLKMNNEITSNLVEFYSKDYENSLYWPYLEVTFLDPSSSGGGSQPIEFNVNILTSDAIQTAASLDILMFNYTYTVINTGANPATVSLQLSPDNIHWYTDDPLQIVVPGQITVLVPNTINRYARLTYQSTNVGQSTALSVYVCGRS